MTTNTVDREAVKVLAIAVGVREAARRMGLSEQRVMKWSQRDQWLKQPEPTPQPPTVTKHYVSSVRKPSEALRDTLEARSGKTKLHLSKYAMDASKTAAKSNGDLRLAKATKDVAGIASITHAWNERDQQPSGPFNLNLMGGRAVIQVNHSTPSPSVQE